MVRQKLALVLLWDVSHNLLLDFFSNTDHWDFPEKQITSVRKGKGVESIVKFSFIAKANNSGVNGYTGWSIQLNLNQQKTQSTRKEVLWMQFRIVMEHRSCFYHLFCF